MAPSEIQTATAMSERDYFRGDRRVGITPPNLMNICTLSDHIVHARGKKTSFTSVSLDLGCIECFGEVNYRLLREDAEKDGHIIVEHEDVIEQLTTSARGLDKAERAKAIQALRYARKRKEGLVDWRFDIARVARKDLIAWAENRVQSYFKAV